MHKKPRSIAGFLLAIFGYLSYPQGGGKEDLQTFS